ncbi:MAG: helix-turn-helix transcriptional regulator [Bacteroidetes bacterium]|nr:helix-turn-helix transcriptional regulator [Bacteroidota bacterium]
MLSELIKNLRNKKGYSQIEMAEMLHTSQPNYHKIELNPEKLIDPKLFRILEILDIPLENIIKEVRPNYFNHVEHSQINTGTNNNPVFENKIEIKDIDSLIDFLTKLKFNQ